MKTEVFVRALGFLVVVASATCRAEQQLGLPDVIIGDPNDPSTDELAPPLSQEELDAAARQEPPPEDDVTGTSDGITTSGFFQGDIVVPSRDHLYQIIQGSPEAQASAVNDPKLKWPNAVVPYVISASFSAQERAVIAGAVLDLHRQTCIRFIPRGEHHADYVHILSGEGCSSSVGRIGGVQVVSLGYGCLYHGIVLHEFMHALGFWHEQSRADRDKYVWVNWRNIEKDMKYNFEKKSNRLTTDLGLTYDYGSVMHYGAYAFAVDRNMATVIPRKPGVTIGQRRRLSEMDVEGINRLYQCNLSQPTPTPTPGPTSETCSDDHRSCWKWVERGLCTSNPYVSRTCRKSCQTCGSSGCGDQHQYCHEWAASGECTKNPDYMKVTCRLSCGLCSG